MLKHLLNNKDRIEHLLKKYPQTRDSDKLLLLAYLYEYTDAAKVMGTKGKWLEFTDIIKHKDFPAFETLSRQRRSFQEDGEYLGTNQKHKKQEASSVRRHFGEKKRDKGKA